MEIKPGDYVRTKEGYICKILELNNPLEDDGYLDHNDIGSPSIQEKNVIKSSPNIIDLIEVSDYVNGYLVKEVNYRCDKTIKILRTDYKYDICECDIKTIVTKEQFKSMEYRIG